MNRKFARALSTFALVMFSLIFAGVRSAGAQGVADNRTDSSIAAAATGVAQAVPVQHQAGGERIPCVCHISMAFSKINPRYIYIKGPKSRIFQKMRKKLVPTDTNRLSRPSFCFHSITERKPAVCYTGSENML